VGGEARQRERHRLEKGLRRMAKEEERLCRAEQRKDMVREVLMQGGKVKWRKDEGGWSSVAEPKLSPIMQSPMGSGKSSGSGAQDGSFLEMAAAARGVDNRRRQYANVGEATGMMLAQGQQAGKTKLGSMQGQGMGRGLAVLGKVMVKFCLPPVVPPRESSQQWDTSRLLDPYPEWELGNLIAIPVDLRRLSEDCKVRRISTGRVVELDDMGPAGPWTGKQLHNLSRPVSHAGMMLQVSSVEAGRGSIQERASVCTRTITTTGFEHSPPHPHAVGHLFDAMLDGFKEAPLIRRALTPRALLRQTSTRSSTATSSDGSSDQPASPSSMQLSVWQSLSNLGLQTTRTTAPVWKKVGIGPPRGSRIPLQPLRPGPDSDTTSSTDRETAAHAQEKDSPRPVQNMDGAAEDHPQEKRDWAMRRTMRKLPEPNPSHHKDDEPGTRRSSPTYTRTSTSPMTQPKSPKATPSSARRQDEAVTIARGAARTAFRQTTGSRRALPVMMISGRMTVRPVSAPSPSRAHPHGAGAAGMTAKTTAKPASAAGTGPGGQGQGQGKGKGNGKGETKEQDDGKGKGQNEKKEGQDKGNGRDKDGQQSKKKGKKETLAGSPEFRQWMRNAAMMLARVVSAYWQVVSPVFDGESELRKRLDKAQATRGDGVLCILAVVFLFLVASVGVWGVRGIIWVVRLLGELGEVLRVVAGL
jgi:hypothetical protein